MRRYLTPDSVLRETKVGREIVPSHTNPYPEKRESKKQAGRRISSRAAKL